MLMTATAPDYLLCLRCGFAGWIGAWLEHCPECASPLPGAHATITPVRARHRKPRVPRRSGKGGHHRGGA